MDTIKSEQSSEDEMHPLDIEPQFVDMKREEFSEPFVAIDEFKAEVGYMLHTHTHISCVHEVASSLCVVCLGRPKHGDEYPKVRMKV
jgi:hypothetical protein